MRGTRCKALRKDFIKRHGRAPKRMQVINSDWKTGFTTYETSEWRRVKKAYREARRG